MERKTRHQLLKEIFDLEAKLEAVYDAAIWGIEHVGMANYASREREAKAAVEKAMGDD